MKLCNLDTPSVSEALEILSAAAASRTIPQRGRVMTSVSNHSAAEGLALLGAYTSIDDPTIRQAFLDLALMLGKTPR